jgi:hypothetical protein
MKESKRQELVHKKMAELGRDCEVWLAGSSRELFDSFMRANEYDLALHVVCDQVLNQGAAISEYGIGQIEEVHKLMEIRDDCAERMRKKMSE